MISRITSVIEPLSRVPLLQPFVRSPRVPVSVGFFDSRVLLASLANQADGSPYLAAFAEAPLSGHRTPTSLTQPNLEQPAAVAETLMRLAASSEIDISTCNLILPDRTARVVHVQLEKFPTSPKDQAELLRWRLRKTTPFPIDDAALDWIAWPTNQGSEVSVMAVAMQSAVLRQYEGIVEALDGRVANVTLETLALSEMAPECATNEIWGILHLSPEGFILLIFRGDIPVFYRCKTYATAPADLSSAFSSDLVPSVDYFKSRIADHSLSRLHLCGSASQEVAITEEISKTLGCPMSFLDLGSLVHIPSDLPIDDAARIRFASCVAPALRGWNK